MSSKGLSRRDFLKFSSLTFSAAAFSPFKDHPGEGQVKPSESIGLVRVSIGEVRIFTEPTYESDVAYTVKRDELMYVYDKLLSPLGPAFNPYWYRVEGGYAHTAYLQPVDTFLNEPAYSIPEGGQIAEVTVPVTQSMRYSKFYGWQPLYRLYYRSVHWVTGVGYGPNFTPWYEITDDLLKITYHVSAKHMRLIPSQEIAPLAVDVPMAEKRIFVNINKQSLTAFQGDELLMHTEVSTGIPNILPTSNGVDTATPRGNFNIQIKMPVRHMGDGALTSEVDAYELPGVPWVSFFVDIGVAFHGTYWHDNYGNEMSHGCVNMRPDEAKWLWRWVTPVIEEGEWKKAGFGTQVFVI
jgi:lipoprotein-anchoring transpeptidase ErfK/SrfK